MRATAERLGVNHSTVLRRIAQFEGRLGAHVFEKLPSGYRLTAAGKEVFSSRARTRHRPISWRRASSRATRACAGFCG